MMWNLDVEAAECLRQVEAVGIPHGTITGFNVSYKKKGWWGRIRRIEDTVFCIDVNCCLLAGNIPQKSLREIIIHEILCTCPGCFSRGKKWEQYGKLMQQTYGYEITRVPSRDQVGLMDPSVKVPSPEKLPKERLLELRPGDFVKHDQFGSGIVLGVKPLGTDAILEIAFQDGTFRKLMQKLASTKMRRIYGETIL